MPPYKKYLAAVVLLVLFIFTYFLIPLHNQLHSRKYVTSDWIWDGVAEGEKEEEAGCVVKKNKYRQNSIHLSAVACGNRINEALVMLKSAVIFSCAPIKAHIFVEDKLRRQFREKLDAWPAELKTIFSYSIYPIQFPADQTVIDWKNLFKACSSQRLFLPDILKDVDSLLYVDTDVLFLRPVEDIWKFLTQFNSSQIAAMSVDSVVPIWYRKSTRHPYVPPNGINSGVLLMNMTRIRQTNWLNHFTEYCKKYRNVIKLGDQDLLNIFFHYFPEKLYIIPCRWNYRANFCVPKRNCTSAEEHGISILHGKAAAFHNDRHPAIIAIYEAVRDYQFGESISNTLLPRMQKKLRESPNGQCVLLPLVFTEEFSRLIKRFDKNGNKTGP